MRIGVSLLWLRPHQFAEIARAAEELGFESVWASDHLILPAQPAQGTGGHGEVPPELPLYDVGALLGLIAGLTTTIRLGTWVYVLPVRDPLVSARVFQSLDVLSNGRVEVGVGVGYVAAEFAAAGIEFRTRGRRTDEAIEVMRRLWAGPGAEFRGKYYEFGPLTLAPRPVQKPWPPILVGGESDAAIRRAVRLGDGWLGMEHTPETLEPVLAKVRAATESAARDAPLSITVAAGRVAGGDLPMPDRKMLDGFEALGVDRVIVRPWRRSAEALDGLTAFADDCLR